MSKVRSDNITNRADDGAPKLVFGAEVPVGYGITGAGGINITGVATAASFSGNLTGNATSATTATNAQGLTGTPNIVVGSVQGTTGTFSGNVTIGGTLTYEDVTNIDAVGIITARSGVSIADSIFHTGDDNTAIRFPAADTFTVETAGSERVRIASGGAAIFKGGLAEKYENAGTTLGAQTNNPLSDGNVILFTGNESGNTTINFTGVHAALSNGETVSFTAIITPNNSGVINAVQIDGQSPAGGLKWSGGSAPTAGSSGQDIYTFQILKTGTGATNYTVYGAAANYA